jgi:hypothetical protein
MTAKTAMSKRPFNPARFTDALVESKYATGLRGGALSLQRQELAAWLGNKHPDDQKAARLEDELEGCRPSHRCMSNSCPECSFAGRDFITETDQTYLVHHPDRANILCVSVVPADGVITPGQLCLGQHVRNVRRWKDKLGKANVRWFLGATDWSFNHHDQDRYAPHWQEHFYGFTATTDIEELKRRLREQFPKTDAIHRPVKLNPWDGGKKALQYMVKPDFFRRIGTDDGRRLGKNGSGHRECRATDKQPLRAREKLELLVHLDQIGIQGRLLMRWLQFMSVGGGSWTIADRGPKDRMRGKGKGWGKSPVSG